MIDPRLLSTLLEARVALADRTPIPRRVDIVCSNCGLDHRTIEAVDRSQARIDASHDAYSRALQGAERRLGEYVQPWPSLERFNPNHDPRTGRFSESAGGGLHSEHEDVKDLVAAHKDEIKEANKDYDRQRKELGREHYRDMRDETDPESREQLESDYQDALKTLEEDRLADIAGLEKDHAEELAELIERIEYEASDESEEDDPGSSRSLSDSLGSRRQAGKNPRMHPGKTAKASSAESILRHCLKRLALTTRWKSGKLTNRQVLKLLEEIHQYGKAWLRHEASEFVQTHILRSLDGADISWDLPLNRKRGLDQQSGMVAAILDMDVSRAFPGVRYHLDRFFRRAKSFVRELILTATMALSGPAPLTGEQLEAADKEAIKQEQYFDRFHDQLKAAPPALRPEIVQEPSLPPIDVITQIIVVEPPAMTPGQFVARVESYANSAWQGAQRINHYVATVQGRFKVERRVLGTPKTEHCDDCPPLADKGWQPIGTLPEIGDTACNGLCLCHWEYAESEDSQPYIQGNAGPIPAPVEGEVWAETEDDQGVYPMAEVL